MYGKGEQSPFFLFVNNNFDFCQIISLVLKELNYRPKKINNSPAFAKKDPFVTLM